MAASPWNLRLEGSDIILWHDMWTQALLFKNVTDTDGHIPIWKIKALAEALGAPIENHPGENPNHYRRVKSELLYPPMHIRQNYETVTIAGCEVYVHPCDVAEMQELASNC